MEGETLFLQLLKLSGVKSEETLEEVFRTLWNTRKSGLGKQDKSYILSLLNLASLEELDPVLACLRCLIRSSLYEDSVNDILKLLPSDLSLDLQRVIVHSLQKFQNQWKEEASNNDKCLRSQTRVCYTKASVATSFTHFSAAKMPSSTWPRHDGPNTCFNHNVIGCSTTNIAGASESHLGPLSILQAEGSSHNLMQGILPSLKSMTWTVENHNSKLDNRVASINLKLQDYTMSPSGETQVKFQLTRDTLDAMLRSMAYISEQLSNIAEPTLGQLQKKQRQ